MLRDFGPKQMKLKRGDMKVEATAVLNATVWRDRWGVYMLSNMDQHHYRRASRIKRRNPWSHRWSTLRKATEWLGLFNESPYCQVEGKLHPFPTHTHLPDLMILHGWMLLSSCGNRYTDWDFKLILMRNLTEEVQKCPNHPFSRLQEDLPWHKQV